MAAGKKIERVEGEQPEKLDLRSLDIAAERRAELLRLFPEVHTEGGKIDFERLRAALGETVDIGRERYGLTWPGKAACAKTIQAPSMGTLLPVPGESVNFDTTENLIIEGDNLEVLKLLQKSYLGQVKMIYIDPPYNTGNDFIYPDNFGENLKTYLQYTGQVDAEGRRFGTNTEADGRFHSKWLNMMYPRLFLARNLLREDGAIFISIDDSELENTRRICNEVFGEENFVTQIEWQKRYTRSNNTDDFTSVIDHIVVFARSPEFRPQLGERLDDANARYANPDNDARGPWKAIPFQNPLSPEERPNLVYPIKHPNGQVILPTKKAWRSSEANWNKLVAEKRVWWGKNGESETPNVKRFLSEVRQGMTPINFWDYEFAGHTDQANLEIKDLFGDKVFDTPKPIRLVQRMLETSVASDDDAIVLDFFAGSGATAHAVLDAEKARTGSVRFILVQLPEPTGRTDFPTIADITKERVRRVIKKLDAEDAGKLDLDGKTQQDRGFRVFKLAESNLLGWDGSASKDAAALEKQLEMHIDHLRQGRTDQDLLYELLLKSGYKLTDKVVAKTLAGKTVYDIADGGLMICLDRALTLELIRAMADEKPTNVVCLDAGFDKNDQLKANAVLTFKSKGVTSFRTV
jgi:adenine-specific DNA-methyltransferase